MILRINLIITKILIITLALCSPKLHALSEECIVNKKITTSLNVRNKASSKGDIIGSLRRDAKVACDKYLVNLNWVKINYKGQIGYAHRNYIDFVLPKFDATSITTEAQAPTEIKTYSLPIYYTLIVLALIGIWLFKQQKWREHYSQLNTEASMLTPNPPEFHLESFLLSVCFGYTFLIAIGETGATSTTRAMAFVITVALYVTMQIEGFKSRPFQFLQQLQTEESLADYIERIKQYAPTISWRCECFHFETRSREVYENCLEDNSDEESQASLPDPVQKIHKKEEKYEEKVVTWRGHENFKFNEWQDLSPNLSEDLKAFKAIKVIYAKSYQFKDTATKQRFVIQKQTFENINKGRDESYSFTEELILQDYKKFQISVIDSSRVSPMLNWKVFVAINALGLSWLHRFWLEYNTTRGSYRFTKLLD